MKKIFNTMKNNVCWVFLVMGVFLAAFNIFGFESGNHLFGENINCYYFYSDSTRGGIALGCSLICFGFLLRRKNQ